MLDNPNNKSTDGLQRGEEALRVSEERLSAIVGSAMDAIITVDERQRVLVFNGAAERIFGCPASQALGNPLDAFLPERFRATHRGYLEGFAATGVTSRSMHSLATIYGLRANGEEFPCEATISQASAGTHKFFTVILRDISKRKKAEQLAERYAEDRLLDELKTRFFSNVHHELRTPLTLILGPIQKMLGSAGLTEKLRRDLELVERNARLLQRHVNDLLDLSKLDAGKVIAEYADVDLAQMARIVAPYFELSAIEYGVRYSLEIVDSLPAQADSPKIERVLVNLLSNAFKFTPAGGSVRFSVRRSGESAVFEVEDTGPGIAPHLRQRIFERFWQAEGDAHPRFSRGTGLGLSIVKEFVSLHRGRVSVGQRESGKGSLFTVELPLSAPAGTEVRRVASEPTLEAARQAVEELEIRKTVQNTNDEIAAPETAAVPAVPAVLVVEDNPDMNTFISETLSEKFRVFSAFDGLDGLKKALRLHPDLILLDVVMPGMSGDRLVRELRRHAELDDVPIVLLSVVTDAKLKVDLLKEGAQDFLAKPFRPDELLAKVQRIIVDRKRATEALRDMRQLSVHLLEMRDLEHKQVAHELHENVAQYLTTVGMYLSSARNLGAAPNAEVQRFLDQGRALLKKCSSEVRAMARVLYPAALDELGLAAAIRWHVATINERHAMEVTHDIGPDLGRLNAEHEFALYRIVEESLEAIRAAAGSATVRVFRDASDVVVEVIGREMSLPDEGAPGNPRPGIQEMRERLRSLGGRLDIASGTSGTTVKAVLSLVPRHSDAAN